MPALATILVIAAGQIRGNDPPVDFVVLCGDERDLSEPPVPHKGFNYPVSENVPTVLLN